MQRSHNDFLASISLLFKCDKKKMIENDPKFLATFYLGIHGITKNSLREALSFYELKKSNSSRGRPIRFVAQMLIFIIYYKEIEINGISDRKISNKQLAATANKIRSVALNELWRERSSVETINQFKSEIPETSVKQWRRNFKAIRETDIDRFHQIYKLIDVKGQKIGVHI